MKKVCPKCRWAYLRRKPSILAIVRATEMLPGWDHFHLERGNFVFFDSRQRSH